MHVTTFLHELLEIKSINYNKKQLIHDIVQNMNHRISYDMMCKRNSIYNMFNLSKVKIVFVTYKYRGLFKIRKPLVFGF